jgi:hypothetical protein
MAPICPPIIRYHDFEPGLQGSGFVRCQELSVEERRHGTAKCGDMFVNRRGALGRLFRHATRYLGLDRHPA